MQTTDPHADPSEVPVEENQYEYADAEAFLQEEIEQIQTIKHHDFHVVDESSADWVMNKIKGWEREREARKAAWIEQDNKLKKKIEWFKGRFGAELELYTTAVLAAQRGKKAKSFKLPCGAVMGYRKIAENVVVHDNVAFQTWVLQHCPTAIVDYVPQIDKATVNDYALRTHRGVVPDGCELTPEHDKFYLRV